MASRLVRYGGFPAYATQMDCKSSVSLTIFLPGHRESKL